MSTLRNDGYRFMVSPDGRDADWINPLELAARAPGWHDCTEMNDAEFDHFVRDLYAKFPPVCV